MPLTCNACGQQILLNGATISIHGMYDNHTFVKFTGGSVDDVIASWRDHNAAPHMRDYGDYGEIDIGPASLCPAVIINANGKELRRIGKMVDEGRRGEYDLGELDRWRSAMLADPDAVALLAAGTAGLTSND